jgi:hypothetical protein
VNPYQPPSAPVRARVDSAAACPGCGAEDARSVSFTWWGGVLGPRLFHMVRCNACNSAYDSQTGGTLRRKILVYQVVSISLALLIFYMLFWA